MNPGDDPLIGRTLDGRYRVRRLLGRGGMGAVYEAEHVGLDKRVAIERITGDVDPDGLARFRREARVAAKISDERVVEIYDVGDDGGHPYIAMEYVEGRDLRSVLRDGPLSTARAIAIAQQILRGLAAIHEAGIVHRDIKPANVIVSSGDAVKIMDFGISKSEREVADITKSGTTVGTPQYMAPEQLLGGPADPRSDLYAVGLTLYEMLAGDPPFAAGSTSELAAKQLRDPAPPLEEVRSGLPPALVAAIERALAKAPADRFASAGDFATALTTEPVSGRRDDRRRSSPSERPRRRPDDWGPPHSPIAAKPDAPGSRAYRDSFQAPEPAGRRWIAPVIVGAIAIGLAIAILTWPRDDAPRPSTEPTAAPGSSASLGSGPAVDAARGPREQALDDERAGKLELAIARYLEAHALAPDPELLFRVGELYERLGRDAEAAAQFRRYLEAAPSARDRDAVTARIARLGPPVPGDAGLTGLDAAVARVDVPKVQVPPPRAFTPPPGTVCRCKPTAPGNVGVRLCHRKYEPACRCRTDAQDDLCPTRLEKCTGGSCDGKPQMRVNGVLHSCSIALGTYHIHAKPKAACSGYSHKDVLDGMDPATAPIREGAYDCNVCRRLPTDVPDLRAQLEYSGAPDSPCRGYRYTGELMEGTIICEKVQ